MEIVIAASWFSVGTLISILMVALGLGLVIFVHELGHFAVAKWCDVQVERFSIGFGPILWSRQWGETEYALSAIPFGGYVKMLGQDDIDPGQETSSENAENPRSYTAKSVPQRMAIISAGVIMNIITGYLFYVGAMRMGIQVSKNEVGFVQPGMPAWKAGLRLDDTLESINGRTVEDFSDVTRGTALSRGDVRVTGSHADGTKFDVVITPDRSGTKRLIGVGPQASAQIEIPSEKTPVTTPNSAADLQASGFQPGDRIVAVGGEPVESFSDFRDVLTRRRADALQFDVQRLVAPGNGDETKPVSVTVPAEPHRWLGLTMEVGEIGAIQTGSPAEKAGILVKDRIIQVQAAESTEPLSVGATLDPTQLPDWFADHAGQDVTVTVEREGKGGANKSFTLQPTDARHWDFPAGTSAPLPIPAIGVAFHFVPSVLAVEPDSPADRAGIKPKDLVTSAVFLRPDNWPVSDTWEKSDVPVDVGDHGWVYVNSLLQAFPSWKVKLTVKPGGQESSREATLESVARSGWYAASDRGLRLVPALREQKADNLGDAFRMGWAETRDSVMDIYLTLRGLILRDISPKELHGPIGIFGIGVKIASNGFSEFLIFLGFLSVNLAVINFLPIPVLDGGHMAFLLWEGVTRRKPNERVYATAMYMGLMFVLSLMGWVIYLDIARRVG